MLEESIGAVSNTGFWTALNSDISSGSGQQVKVDLQALYDYYFHVKRDYDEFTDATKDIQQSPYDNACVATSEIPGVAQAIEATSMAAQGSYLSMRDAIKSVRELLAAHLTAVAEADKGYVKVDVEKSQDLQGAATSKVGGVAYGNGPPSGVQALGGLY